MIFRELSRVIPYNAKVHIIDRENEDNNKYCMDVSKVPPEAFDYRVDWVDVLPDDNGGERLLVDLLTPNSPDTVVLCEG